MNTLNRSLSPEIKQVEKFTYRQPRKLFLNNGVPVWLVEGGAQEILRVEFVFHSGSFHQQKPLQAYAATNLLKSGTKEKSAADISNRWDFYGASLQIEAQKDITSVGFFCLTKHFVPLLDTLMEVITHSVFPEYEMEILLTNRKNKHIINTKKVSHLARVHFNEMVFGSNHPYGRILSINDFDTIRQKDLLEYYHGNFTADNCSCFISGNIPENITDVLNEKVTKYNWISKHTKYEPPSFSLNNKPLSNTLTIDSSVQSSVRIGKRMLNRTHQDFPKVSLTNSLLGGFFGSRLMRNIRQDKGYTYGISSSVVSLLKDAYFFIGSQVGKDVKDKAIEQIFLELKKLREVPVDQTELNILTNYLTASFLRSFDGPFMQMERFKELHLFGMDYSYFDHYLETLSGIREKDIMETARKYFHEDDMFVMVAG